MSQDDFYKRLYWTIIKAIVGGIVTVALTVGGTVVYIQSRMQEHEQRLTRAERDLDSKADKIIVIYRLDKIEAQNARIEDKIDNLTKRQQK